MGMLDDLLAQPGNTVDIGALAGKFGVDPAVAQSALGQLQPQIADPGVDNKAAFADVAGKTGLDAGVLMAMLPQLLAAVQGSGGGSSQGDVPGQLLSGLQGGPGSGGGGMLGQIAGMLDRDGDGNPLNDIMGMLGKK
jgi:hypothetical protein